MSINIGILHYKTIDKTIECVSSIIETEPSSNIYIIDNYSNDGSLESLKTRYSSNTNIYYICLKDNLGFARANNICMRLLREKGESSVILTNNDIVFTQFCIQQLIKTLHKSDAALVAPKVLNKDGVVMDSVLPFRDDTFHNYLWHKFCGYLKKNTKVYAQEQLKSTQIKTFHGCCFACNLEYMERIGYMDEHTFLYFEEPILASKIESAGYHMLYEPAAKVYHYHGATTSSNREVSNVYKEQSQKYYLVEYLGANRHLVDFLLFLKKHLRHPKY